MSGALLLALSLPWDPALRGIAIVAVAVAILCGSVYLLLATNTGTRLGFLIAAAGLAGWMMLMAGTWWIYAIGLVGDSPTWQVTEIVRHDDPRNLEGVALPEARDLSDWTQIPADDPSRGEASAAADEAIAGSGPVAQFETTSDYVVIGVLDRGGKDPDALLSQLPLSHPPHHAIVQVQQVVEVEVAFGEAPPPAEADPTRPIHSIVMVRDLGSERLPPAVITIASMIIFGVACNALHRRDKAASEARARALAAAP
ncbi:MAG TPA: hypothetical protein VMN58_03190 [Acidimicrobiales bacterium]|nr:hypothetical protein [Acidimicrobiales bacterium]